MMSSPASWRRRASVWVDHAAAPRPATGSTRRAARVVDAEEAPAGADCDQLDRAPGGLLDKAMAPFGQRGERRRGQPAPLVIQRIGQPLVVKARRGDRLIRREAEI